MMSLYDNSDPVYDDDAEVGPYLQKWAFAGQQKPRSKLQKALRSEIDMLKTMQEAGSDGPPQASAARTRPSTAQASMSPSVTGGLGLRSPTSATSACFP